MLKKLYTLALLTSVSFTTILPILPGGCVQTTDSLIELKQHKIAHIAQEIKALYLDSQQILIVYNKAITYIQNKLKNDYNEYESVFADVITPH
jgi:hypothetical protein